MPPSEDEAAARMIQTAVLGSRSQFEPSPFSRRIQAGAGPDLPVPADSRLALVSGSPGRCDDPLPFQMTPRRGPCRGTTRSRPRTAPAKSAPSSGGIARLGVWTDRLWPSTSGNSSMIVGLRRSPVLPVNSHQISQLVDVVLKSMQVAIERL